MQADGSFFEQPRNKATKMAKLCSFVALLLNHSALLAASKQLAAS
jgi:hypothetical protein